MNGRSETNPNEVRHICEAATGRCQATTEQRTNQLIDENALPCSGINFTTPGNKAIVLTGQCPAKPKANTCPYYCKEGYRPYDSGSGTKCEEVFKIVFTGTSVTTGEIIFAGRKEAKNFIYS
ncbi:MAG: hypothetical protein K6E76_04880 [Patescibacteria group bacterium]|nr:hypothetical protein [Patescibacteria group bacterium]